MTDQRKPTKLAGSAIGSTSPGLQLLARARYNNVAEAKDELSFRQGDIVTVLQKDFNKQVDWWLCELRGQVGMVPANYFEIFHDHDPSTYDIPRPTSKSSRTSSSPRTTPLPLQGIATSSAISRLTATEETDSPIYDLPPVDADDDALDRDYDLPPQEDPMESGYETYDRPPSSTRISPQGSTRSSVKSMNRISTASSATSSCIYDMPPDLADVYDFPKPSQPARGFEEDERQNNTPTLLAVDISSMRDTEAEELLSSYCQVISATYEVLYQSVYGSEAYWGTDHKSRRAATLKRTITAVKHFDRALMALLEFGKGVVNKIEKSSDVNFKKKYMNVFKTLIHNRNDILAKLEALNSEIDSITATVKSLLELARSVPHVVNEFTVLVQANKALLFKVSNKSASSLPVITKNEVKSRPLPELPSPAPNAEFKEGDYAIPLEAREKEEASQLLVGRKTPDKTVSESTLDYNGTISRKRNPNDHLPPLPYATMPRQGKGSPAQKKKSTQDQGLPTRSGSPYGGNSPYSSKTNIQQMSPASSKKKFIDNPSEDYDEIDKTRDRSIVITSRPSIASLGSSSSQGASPTHLRMRRQGSLSSCSGSSEDLNNSGFRRVNSADLLDGPYGTPNGYHQRQGSSSPQPLRLEEKQLLDRFAKQLDLIVPGLKESVTMFLDCIKDSEPPKDFVTKSKLTVVAAYKLVYIADALSQKILHNETKAAILSSTNDLTEGIKNLVVATKTAALQYPSVIALDKMNSCVQQLFPSALDLINSVKCRASLV